MSNQKLRFSVNKIYKPDYTSGFRYRDIHGGRGRGGSHFVTQRFLEKITMPYYFRGYFIRKVKADIKGSLYQDFKDRVSEHPTLTEEDFIFNESEYSITCKFTGNAIKSRGTTSNKDRKANLKSIAGATDVAIEECDEISEEEFDQLDISLRTTKAPIVIYRIYNQPPKGHWIYRDYNLVEKEIVINGKPQIWYKAEVKSESGILSIFSTFRDNIRNLNDTTIKRLNEFKFRNPEYYWNQVEGYISSGLKGQIYSGWKACTNRDFDQIDEPIIYGLDFGYSDHVNALVGVKKHYDKRYVKEMLFESGLDNFELARRFIALGLNEDDIIVADPGGGGDLRIAELRNGIDIDGKTYYFSVFPATKNPGSVLYGINKIKGLDVFVTEDSANMWNEYYNYRWLLNANKEPTDKPNKADDMDNTLDAFRYTEITRI